MLSPTSQALADVRDYLAERARVRAASEAFEAEAQATAERYGYDLDRLAMDFNAVSFGSAALSWNACHERRVLSRALIIAGARADEMPC